MGIRAVRLAQQLRQEIAMIIHREVKDPRLGFVTVTWVKLSNDLSHAKVSYSCLGGEEDRARSQAALDDSAPFIRGLIKKRLTLKIIPALVFLYDPSIEASIAMSDTLERLHETPPHDEEPPATA
ncbi:MAG TPA: 30S ribosome-binding factor RbfA [bacterium]